MFETWSQKQADRYYNLLINEFEYIAKHFETGKSMESIKHGSRATKVKSNLVFYRKCGDDIVEIIRILHERMDIENRLSE
ncbi:MAG: type II toxin-antitoxin system RelE/ParE family toxin [Mucilaginibacter sp.]|uniref:type II toxin-antitoxin system RelE/ParE family toxin n=1 Tax=Mucilaginibacter sp. TaxID=1882438 RepID=UPI0034E3FF8F